MIGDRGLPSPNRQPGEVFVPAGLSPAERRAILDDAEGAPPFLQSSDRIDLSHLM
jgi:hypothetical protein